MKKKNNKKYRNVRIIGVSQSAVVSKASPSLLETKRGNLNTMMRDLRAGSV
jgi:hypothetical protein